MKRTCRSTLFQQLILVVALLAQNSCNFLILGLPFMKGEPKHFTCKDRETGEWHTCSKQYICENHLSKEEYQPDTEDSQYIDNWQNQTNMLCESKARIGFLGACFFIGVLVASTVVPVGLLSDIIGRKWIFVTTLIILIVSEVGFIYASSLDMLYASMFLLGLTFPGRIIVGINYAQEFLLQSWIEGVQPLNQATQGLTLILTAIYFQFISRSVIYLEFANLLLTVVLLVTVLGLFPESPRFSFSKERFDEARGSLDQVARFNGVDNYNK